MRTKHNAQSMLPLKIATYARNPLYPLPVSEMPIPVTGGGGETRIEGVPEPHAQREVKGSARFAVRKRHAIDRIGRFLLSPLHDMRMIPK